MAEMIRVLLKEQGNLIKTLKKRETHRPMEGGGVGGYNWLLTYTGRDCMDYAGNLVLALIEGTRVCVCVQSEPGLCARAA